ncbi:MAG: DEAD/DEAH box helicase, partial [Methanomicrobiales archaeon]|nr:DEAD/DEAH box helicase [Methanomicrobiales archaeon]
AAPALLVCPTSIVGNWQREFDRFSPNLAVTVHHGSNRAADDAFVTQVGTSDVVITTYQVAVRDRDLLESTDWNSIILDEAQNIKNPSTKQAKAVRALQAPRRIALTGTPVENRLTELWSIMEFLNPGYLGSFESFQSGFAIPIERYHDPKTTDNLREMIRPFVLRRMKTDRSIISDLPEKMEMKVYCNLTTEQATLYEAVVQEMLERAETAEGIQRRGIVLGGLTRLKQICDHPALFLHDKTTFGGRSGKIERLDEMLEAVLESGERALIFTQFAEFGGLLEGYLCERFGTAVLYLHGRTPRAKRDAMVQQFQQPGGPPLFILSLKAGGTGLNLTAANHVFHLDRWWNPAVENQATDRAFRIGQTRDVQVRLMISSGTLEEQIDRLIEEKMALADQVVGKGEDWIGSLSTDQLRELLTLRRDAVEV